jgi:hypothetical protein
MQGSRQELYHLADERGLAQLGLAYAQNDHDRDRYGRGCWRERATGHGD